MGSGSRVRSAGRTASKALRARGPLAGNLQLASCVLGYAVRMPPINFWINIANVLYLGSYSVRDILWLRILTVAAALLLIPYYALQTRPLVTAIEWNVVFIAINLFWIVKLMIERRPVHFTPDEAQLKLLSFTSLTDQEARSLFDAGKWEDLSPGESIVKHDLEGARLSVILRGVAAVIHSGKMIATFGEGQFLGAIDEHATELDVDVVVQREACIMCWSRSHLQHFLANRPAVALALRRSVGLEVWRLLDSMLSK
jgi:hypothetical protein